MKKIALTIISAVAIGGAAFAQGTIQWTSPTSNVIGVTNGTTYSTLVGGVLAGQSTGGGTTGNVPLWSTQPFYYTLLYTTYTGSQATNPTTLAALDSWLPAWNSPAVYATNFNTAANGRLNMAGGGSNQQTVNWANGTTSSIMLIGWSGNLGSTWGAVSNVLANWDTMSVANAFFGESVTGWSGAGVGNPGAVIFGSSAGQIFNPSGSPMNLYLLAPVPEPSTMALAGLGGLSLLLFRRRKV